MIEKWKIYAFVSMFFAGLTSVIAKFGMEKLTSDVALTVRTAVVFLIISANGLLMSNAIIQIKSAPKSNLLFLAISGITTSLSWIFYYRAIKDGPVSYVASIDKGSILITILLSFILLNEPMTWKVILASILITAGLLILAWK